MNNDSKKFNFLNNFFLQFSPGYSFSFQLIAKVPPSIANFNISVRFRLSEVNVVTFQAQYSVVPFLSKNRDAIRIDIDVEAPHSDHIWYEQHFKPF